MASVVRLCPQDDRYDPDLLRLRDEDVPAAEAASRPSRKCKFDGL